MFCRGLRSHSISNSTTSHCDCENLRSFLERRAKYLLPLGTAIQTVSGWIGDLIHLVPIFGGALLEALQAIRLLIPPVCPASLVIHQSFRSLTAVGIVEDDWNDCLSYNVYECAANPLNCKDNKFAVSLSNGNIVL